MNIKNQFSIKDLENLSGVKAHTIRIWEKRYSLLQPNRTETNIRTYDLDNLKRLLNVTLLYRNGHKISKIAKLSQHEVQDLVQNQASNSRESHALKILKTAMFEFDERKFTETYLELLESKSFREVFSDVFLPLLMGIGMLWQSGTIEPCHESFVSELLKRKIIVNIEEQITSGKKKNEPIFILFLPYREIHEIGLLYANYEVLSAGFRTVYLGANIPLDNLDKVVKKGQKVIFLSYLTMLPEGLNIYDYIDSFQQSICKQKVSDLWLLGGKVQDLDSSKTASNIHVVLDLQNLIDRLKDLNNS